MSEDLFSTLACVFQLGVVFSALHQIYLHHKHRVPEQISGVQQVITLASCVLWAIHSAMRSDYYLLIPQLPAITFTLIIIAQKFYFTRLNPSPSTPSHSGA